MKHVVALFMSPIANAVGTGMVATFAIWCFADGYWPYGLWNVGNTLMWAANTANAWHWHQRSRQ